MKNEHLIPPIILDLAEKSNSPIVRENEKMNYILRLEAIRDYCSLVITKHNNNKSNIKSNMRKVP
jgi:hypothetical protein